MDKSSGTIQVKSTMTGEFWGIKKRRNPVMKLNSQTSFKGGRTSERVG